MAGDPQQLASRRGIAIGTSMGGLAALERLLSDLPADLPASLFVVRHVGDHGGEALARRLARSARLRIQMAVHGEPVACGTVYLAPADRHMLVRAGRLRLTRGPRENRARPAIDPLFRSVGVAYQARAVGVVLTGLLDDGSAGLAALRRCGGVAVVEDPASAAFPEMPCNALAAVPEALKVPIEALSGTLVGLVHAPVPEPPLLPADVLFELDVAECALDDIARQEAHGVLVPQVCPDCGGPLWRMEDAAVPRFRCHTGHAFSAQVLLAQQRAELERHLWGALRALRERARLLRRMAEMARARGHDRVAAERDLEAAGAEADGIGIRRYLLAPEDPPQPPPEA